MKDHVLTRGYLKVKREFHTRFSPLDRNYQRFILLSRGRMGSNLLLTLLNNHPEVVSYFEPFRRKLRKKREVGVKQYGKQYLDEYFFRPFPKHINAVGIKMFYTHGRFTYSDGSLSGPTRFGPVWDYFYESPSIKVIQLTRENLLRVYLSEQKARRSGLWYIDGTNSQDSKLDEPIELDYDHCLTTFRHIRQRENEFSELFQNHKKLNVEYDELLRNRDITLNKIQQFLNIHELNLSTFLRKQTKGSLSANIANYDELKQRFKGTEWEQFFEE